MRFMMMRPMCWDKALDVTPGAGGPLRRKGWRKPARTPLGPHVPALVLRRKRACGAFVHIEFGLVITYRKRERDVIAHLQGLHPERRLTDQSPADA